MHNIGGRVGNRKRCNNEYKPSVFHERNILGNKNCEESDSYKSWEIGDKMLYWREINLNK